MDLQCLANPAAESVNPNVLVSVQASRGYAAGGPGLRQMPQYYNPVTGYAQVQELTSSELRLAEGLNLQGVMKTIYFRGNLNGVIRPESKGGDLVTMAIRGQSAGTETWLVVKTLEQWPTWSKALIVLQVPKQ